MTKKIKNIEYYEAIGRRKESTARVRLYIKAHPKIKKGDFLVNDNPLSKVYSSFQVKFALLPLTLTENERRFAVSVKVRGGGKNGQLEAIVYGLSRCLVKVDPEYKKKLKKIGLLTRDSREKERRKVGTGGKARRAKQSPKR